MVEGIQEKEVRCEVGLCGRDEKEGDNVATRWTKFDTGTSHLKALKNFSKKSRLPFINFLIHIINLSQVKVSEFQFAKFQDCLIKFFHQKYCKQYKSQLKPYKVLKNFDKSLKLPLINENSVTSCFKPKLDICNPNCKINNYIFDQQCFTIEQLATYVSNMWLKNTNFEIDSINQTFM